MIRPTVDRCTTHRVCHGTGKTQKPRFAAFLQGFYDFAAIGRMIKPPKETVVNLVSTSFAGGTATVIRHIRHNRHSLSAAGPSGGTIHRLAHRFAVEPWLASPPVFCTMRDPNSTDPHSQSGSFPDAIRLYRPIDESDGGSVPSLNDLPEPTCLDDPSIEPDAIGPPAKPKTVTMQLGDVASLLIEARQADRAWVVDFADEPVQVTEDLYEILLAYQKLVHASDDAASVRRAA